MSRINLFMCGNGAVADGLILATLSVAKHTKRPVSLYVGTMDLSELDERYTPVCRDTLDTLTEILKEANPLSEAVLLDLGAEFKEELMSSKNIETAYTPYAMLRLVADKSPALPDKLIYLDTDVLLCGDIGELYDIDVEDCDYAAARDYYGRRFINPKYINSGVMLWNLGKMREDGTLVRCRKMCNEKKMLLCDQTALYKCAERKLLLPDRFNEQHKTEKDTLVRHFSMRIRWLPFFRTEKIKPWQPELMHGKLKEYRFDDIIGRWQEIKNTARVK